ncbi:hypothetical protein EVAR_85368_1 [Eumeta japonica]|uniref:Uncharacterized protein n=1 Tax=Eumeta variegata TaxID=151549 RepID=A0A4C1WVH5_EUMVA|nr:hypothetical protein EVAR_85368_1 [Eumeta japonica]
MRARMTCECCGKKVNNTRWPHTDVDFATHGAPAPPGRPPGHSGVYVRCRSARTRSRHAIHLHDCGRPPVPSTLPLLAKNERHADVSAARPRFGGGVGAGGRPRL